MRVNVDPLRDNRADPILRVKVVRRPFAAFRCLDTTCTHLFAGDIPAIFEDLPSCPICECDSQIECLLVSV